MKHIWPAVVFLIAAVLLLGLGALARKAVRMYTIDALIALALDLDTLTLDNQIEASVSVRMYLAEYAIWGLEIPAALTIIQRSLAGQLDEKKHERDVVVAEEAKKRVRDRLPGAERRGVIQAEIAALQAELERTL